LWGPAMKVGILRKPSVSSPTLPKLWMPKEPAEPWN